MSEEYLWNRTGEPDPEVLQLENMLGQLRHSGAKPPQNTVRPGRFHAAWWLAAAAVLLAGLLLIPLWLRGPVSNWQMANGGQIRAGQTIETGGANATTIQSSDTGEVTIDPGSRFRLIASGREQSFDLQRGTIHAFIWAPPGRFTVTTPSSKAVDLGCRYTLQVSKDGTGLLTVELGWVAFERSKVESFIPAGAACVTRPASGPGIPYFSDAPDDLRKALARFDASGDTSAFDAALAAARPRDALSLWHMMLRTQGEKRARAFDRLSVLVKMPADATREAVLEGNGNAIDAAWNALDLGTTDWWREWKRQW